MNLLIALFVYEKVVNPEKYVLLFYYLIFFHESFEGNTNWMWLEQNGYSDDTSKHWPKLIIL